MARVKSHSHRQKEDDPLTEFAEFAAAIHANDGIFTNIEKNRGEAAAVIAASHLLELAAEYLIRRRGTTYLLGEITRSIAIGDALAEALSCEISYRLQGSP
jgi:hypothetical protein